MFITQDPARDGVNWYIYCENSPLTNIDPTGLAHFGKRAMNTFGGIYWPKVMSYTPGTFVIEKILDKENIELCHEQLFFDDGSGENIGFGWSKENNGLFSEVNIDNYEMDNKYYDDNLIRQAVENVEHKGYSLLGKKTGDKLASIAKLFGKDFAKEFIGDGEKNNCQDWAASVRTEYKNLYKNLTKEERKEIKAAEKAWKQSQKQEIKRDKNEKNK